MTLLAILLVLAAPPDDGPFVEHWNRWKNGLQDGKWIWWHRNGQRKRVVFYEEGQPDGWEQTWDEKGRRTSHVKWKKGKRVG